MQTDEVLRARVMECLKKHRIELESSRKANIKPAITNLL